MKKRYLYVAALAALLNFSSCSNSFLDLNPDTAITANTFYKTAEHFDQALVASYTAFRSIAQTGIMMDEMRSDNSDRVETCKRMLSTFLRLPSLLVRFAGI